MKILLTGTRAPATLDLARRLAAEGAEVIGADSAVFPAGRFSSAFSSHQRVPSPRFERAQFVAAIAGLALAQRVDWIWPTCEEIFALASEHEALGSVAKLMFEPLRVLVPLHHKGQFVELVNALGGGGVRAPQSWPAAEAPADKGRRLIWKPYYSRFAAQTRFDEPPEDPRGWLAQEFIAGQEYCAWALVVGGEVRTLTFYTCPAKAGRGAGCAFTPAWLAEAAEFIGRLAAELKFTGSLAFDFIQQADGGIYVIECNPRLTSGIHVLSEAAALLPCLEGRAMALPPPMSPAQLFLPVLATAPDLAGTTRDVLWRGADRWPALSQPLTVAEIAWTALRRGCSLTAATTYDIEFNGDL